MEHSVSVLSSVTLIKRLKMPAWDQPTRPEIFLDFSLAKRPVYNGRTIPVTQAGFSAWFVNEDTVNSVREGERRGVCSRNDTCTFHKATKFSLLFRMWKMFLVQLKREPVPRTKPTAA